MDMMKWAWVLFVAASLALLIRLSMWFLPAPGWRDEKVDQAAEAAETAAVSEELPVIAAPPLPVSEPVRPPAPAAPIQIVHPPPAPAPEPPEEFHLRRVRWDMSPGDVRAAERDAPLRESASGLTYLATTLELPCLLVYSFEEGRLVRVRMSYSDPTGTDLPPLTVAQALRRFQYLREQLRSRYGEPIRKTVTLPRNLSHLERSVQRQDELAKEYDVEIAEANQRIRKQREILERRFKRWSNKTEMVARGLAPYERDLKDLQNWKKESLARAGLSRKNIQEQRAADTRAPLVAWMTARWPYARELHDVALKLDLRAAVPRLDLRYEKSQGPSIQRMDDL